MLVVTEMLAGGDVPPPGIPALFTMADVYGYYRDLCACD